MFMNVVLDILIVGIFLFLVLQQIIGHFLQLMVFPKLLVMYQLIGAHHHKLTLIKSLEQEQVIIVACGIIV